MRYWGVSTGGGVKGEFAYYSRGEKKNGPYL